MTDAEAAVILANAIDRLADALEAQPKSTITPSKITPTPSASQLTPMAAIVAKLTMPRGIRNNNPGNVRLSRDNWQGEIVPGKDKSFMQFQTMVMGVRCSATILHGYYARHGLRTISQYIDQWAPPTENNTNMYAKTVASKCEVGASDPYPLDRVVNLTRLCTAIFHVENGGDYVSASDIAAGVALVKL